MRWRVARNPKHRLADAIISLIISSLLASMPRYAPAVDQAPTTQPAIQEPFVLVGTLEGAHIDTINPTTVAFTPDGRLFLTWDHLNFAVRLWNLRTLTPVTEPLKHPGADRFSLTADGKTVFTSGGGEVRLWDVATSKTRATVRVDAEELSFFDATTDGTRFLAIACDGTTLTVWDTRGARPTKAYEIAHTRDLLSAQFDPAGRYIVDKEYLGPFELLRADTGKAVCAPFDTHVNSSTAPYLAQFDPAGRRLAIPLEGGFRLLECESGKIVAEPHGRPDLRTDLISFSPDGSLVAITTESWPSLRQGPVLVFDAATAGIVRQINSVGLLRCQLSPGHRFLLCNYGNNPDHQLIDLKNGETVQMFHSMKDNNGMARMSPDGQTVLVGTGAETISVWRLRQEGLATKPTDARRR